MRERPILFSAPMVCAILEGRKTQTRRVLKPQPFWNGGSYDRERHEIRCYCDALPPGALLRRVGGVRHGYVASNYEDGDEGVAGVFIGDRLWVRETWRYAREPHCRCPQASMADPCDRWKAGEGCESVKGKVLYRADGEIATGRWRPSIHMPRWASRITLEVTSVNVERLQSISEADAREEGLRGITKDGQLIKYGVPDRDGLPGNDDCGWPWCEWRTDPREAFQKLWNTINGPGAWDQNPWVAAYTFKVLDTKGPGNEQ